ncbi:MAG: anaerobic nitric oxide reductase flavorubredoxin [Bacillota bacterium]
MIKIKDNVYWVGVRDWELKKFHGDELSTHRGSSYNSYLIKDKKVALVDTVWTPFHEGFVKDLEQEIGLKNIGLIVVNHTEQDHAGSLSYLMEKIPDTPIFCTKNGAMMIKKHFHRDWNVNIVKTGDSVEIGDSRLVFVEMAMLHWPDNMATFVSGANVLLSNDAFGQHYAAPHMFNDLVDQGELYQEAMKYFANILTPYSRQVKGKIKEVLEMNLSIEMIAPSHGVIWRENPLQIVHKYEEWASDYNEGTVAVLFDSMWGATKKMALSIARGIERRGVGARVINVARRDKSDIITEVFRSKGVIVGSSTINRGVLSSTAAILEMIKGLQFKKKIGAAFGSYGWSGESVRDIEEKLKNAGIEIVLDGIKMQYDPEPGDLKSCEAFGEAFAEKV